MHKLQLDGHSTKSNLFEQQAEMDRAVAQSKPAGLLGEIAKADIRKCYEIAAALNARIRQLEQRHDGMKAASLQLAAEYCADAALELGAADGTEEHQCSECDSCVCARSDEHYDRKRDGELK